MSGQFQLRGLYAITDTTLTPPAALLDAVAEAVRGGAVVVQYRDKGSSAELRLQQATALNRLCRQYSVPLLINDDVELARLSGAAGVHLGREDSAIAAARAQLGSEAVIGCSCYNDLSLADAAVAAGADYVAFGRFFSSSTKPEAVAADPALLQRARGRFHCPIVAIGGITPENGAALVAAGADMLAIISALYRGDGPYQNARAVSRLFAVPI
ncbi:MAG: thiamine phosphate synthase [Gammaproteobacteria bacterium]|nr:thiamine phosphate synthase [Gammaproteobacteria bacterium]